MPDQSPHFYLHRCLDTTVFAGTDRGLLQSVLDPWLPVPKCAAPPPQRLGRPFQWKNTLPWHLGPVHTTGPRRQSQNPPLQKSSAIPA